MEWFYMDGGRQQGPVNESAMAALLRSGVITQETAVWREGLADWVRLSDSALGVPSAVSAPSAAALPPQASAPAAQTKAPSPLARRIAAACVDISVVVIASAGYLLHVKPCIEGAVRSLWVFPWSVGWWAFVLLSLASGLWKGLTPGRLLMGVRSGKGGRDFKSFWVFAGGWLLVWLPPLLYGWHPEYIAANLLALLVPVILTGGRRGAQDFVFGTCAEVQAEGRRAVFRWAGAGLVCAQALFSAARSYDDGCGCLYFAPGHHFCVCFPVKEMKVESRQDVTSVRAPVYGPGGGGSRLPVHFTLIYRDLPDGGAGFDLGSLVQSFGADGVTYRETFSLNGYPAYRWGKVVRESELVSMTFENEAVVAGGRLFILTVSGSSADMDLMPRSAVNRFMGSLRFFPGKEHGQ